MSRGGPARPCQLSAPPPVRARIATHAPTHMPQTASIVNTQIAAAMGGECGDVHTLARTKGTELFTNPLMTMYFTVDLDEPARHMHQLPQLEHTRIRTEVALVIEEHRDGLDRPRPRHARRWPVLP
jgi:hypothetical protein